MATTVGQMEKELNAKEKLIVEDASTIERLSQDASTMFDMLITRLEQYKNASEVEDLPPQTNALQGIPSCITRLGIPNGNRINVFLDGNITHSPPQKQQQPVSRPNGGALFTPPLTMPIATARAAAAPKFTWAATKSTSAGDKMSLLDVQKEELMSKTGP
jgi:hypothetical protein